MTDFTLRRALALAAAVAFTLPLASLGAAAQDPPAPPADKPAPPEKTPEEKKAEEIKEFVKHYEEGLAKMTGADAIAGIDKMKAWYVDPKTDEASKKVIMGVFSTKVVKFRGEGKDAYLEAAAKALGEMGGDTAVTLLRFLVEYGDSQKIQITAVIRSGLSSLGKIASTKPGDVKYLTEMLKGKDEFIGDAARALSGYKKAPGVLRKDIFEELLKMCEGVFSKQQANDNNAKRRWNIWGSEVIDAMKAVTRQERATPIEFREWLNDKGANGGKNPRTWADDPDTKDQKN